ncbi:uncharacterized protein [Chelonus insularis]|uniref:uncharacterized protein isoform X2 n=1 Tax=Chelonus insularis TaxID=460826 RepID=UPI00158C31F7|nr:uncharacterized protein LOC118069590 isoform X2 [Chelonus insularis]XP_034943692.1 uncharacterized protein LOC118069590 isoform X2 [Chelonus insularis]
MWNIICLILLSYLIPLNTAESSYDIVFYDVEATEINHEYFSYFESYVNEDNSGIFTNFTIIKRLPVTTRLSYNLLASTLGEFILKTGVTLDINICEIFEPHYRVVGDQIEQIGINGDNCPPGPGIYGAENIGLDPENLPDVFIPNNYVAIMKLYNGLKTIGVFKAFVRIAV